MTRLIKAKRLLYLCHRWLGIVMCLFFAMWFLSGMVMMYVGFPSLSERERLAGLPPLDPGQLRVPVSRLLERAQPGTGIQRLRLTTVRGRPAYLLQTSGGAWRGLFADNGEPLGTVTQGHAVVAARRHHGAAHDATPGRVIHQGVIRMDQWTVSGSLQPHRPLHRVAVNDRAGTDYYVSSRTGQVVRDTDRRERLWNWLGANLHWVYPLPLRRHPDLWHRAIVVLSLAGLVAIVTGGVIGFMRLRLRRRYRGKDVTPYRGLMKYHHLLGLTCLVFLATWMFSGLMSMNPWEVFTPRTSFGAVLSRYRGQPDTDQAPATARLPTLRLALSETPGTREVQWRWLDGRASMVLTETTSRRRLVEPAYGSTRISMAGRARRRLVQLMSGHSVKGVELLDEYDAYYYSHHGDWKPLPALRLRFDDDQGSWFHVDPVTGELMGRLTGKDRLQRWLYNGITAWILPG